MVKWFHFIKTLFFTVVHCNETERSQLHLLRLLLFWPNLFVLTLLWILAQQSAYAAPPSAASLQPIVCIPQPTAHSPQAASHSPPPLSVNAVVSPLGIVWTFGPNRRWSGVWRRAPNARCSNAVYNHGIAHPPPIGVY